jgi:hypothetical protein
MPETAPTSRFWPRCALVVWLGASLFVAVDAYRNPRGHTLYDIYALGICNWWHAADLYPRQQEKGELFRYSPAFAVATGRSPCSHRGPATPRGSCSTSGRSRSASTCGRSAVRPGR